MTYLFELQEYLKQVDGYREYLPTCLKNLLILFILRFHIIFKIYFSSGFVTIRF